jgi:hypothetical protein
MRFRRKTAQEEMLLIDKQLKQIFQERAEHTAKASRPTPANDQAPAHAAGGRHFRGAFASTRPHSL